MTETKAQERRREAYQQQLRRCRFRSWTRANERRGELIDRQVYMDDLSDEETKELEQLQKLCDLYVKWKTNDWTGRSIRRLQRLARKLDQTQ